MKEAQCFFMPPLWYVLWRVVEVLKQGIQWEVLLDLTVGFVP